MALFSQSIGKIEDFGNNISRLPPVPIEALAIKGNPAANGAIGRNKKDYFHVRFQLGMHHRVYHRLIHQDVNAIDSFLKAVEYSMSYQLDSGEFTIHLPLKMRLLGKLDESDLVSGTSFFASSLGTGWLALETNDWIQCSAACYGIRTRMERYRPRLQK